jgi:peptidoglycan/xylan/chitin deacetylase (PgdA/CDA1 family)
VTHQASITLTFHGIGECARALEPGEARVWLTRDEFTAVLDAASDRSDVRITFDDGNASDLAIGLPGLARRGLVGTFFVVAGRLDTPGFLGSDDVRALAQAGMTIGCHGMRHRPWRELDGRALHEELVDAKRVLEQVVDADVVEAACPFGSYDRRVLGELRRAGYRRVYTSDRGPSRRADWLQARNTILAGEGAAALQRIPMPATRHARLRREVRLAAKRWR